jgi:serine/threonine-protein kinase
MKDFGTAEYAAPEQWRGERPTKATDIYALGCIIYQLVQATLPFPGPERADFSRQHQFDAPKRVDAPPHLRRLAAYCAMPLRRQ